MFNNIFENKILNSNGSVLVMGLNDKVQASYVWNLFGASKKNILVITNTLYEANMLYKSLNQYDKDNILLFPMDDFLVSEAVATSPDLMSKRIETLNELSKNNIGKNDYSKTLEYVLLNNIYDEKYLKEYKDIEFNKQSNFEEILTSFLPKGYTGKEINYILTLSNKNIEILKKEDHIDISHYYKIKNFDVSKIKRYNSYKEKENVSYEDVVTRVNLKLDLPVYTDTTEVKDADNLLVLVNKYNHLPKNYKPSDLTYVDGAYGNKVPMREVIKDSFIKLQNAAKNEININRKYLIRNGFFY